MSFKHKPSWLLQPSALQDIIKHHMFLPQNIPDFTNLPDSSLFNNGIKRFLFWKDQLAPSLDANMVFLAFLGPQGLKTPDFINVTTALHNVIDLTKISEFYRGADTHFTAISFNSKEPVSKILSHFLYYEDSIVLAITSNETPYHRFKLSWLPPLFDITRVHHLLDKYSLSHRLRREHIPIANGGYSPTNVISGFLTLHPDTTTSSLPHLIKLPSPHKGCALLTIEGRPPLCLKCHDVGHTRQQCDMIKCRNCSKVHFPSSPCGFSSYSSVASRNITNSSAEDWLERLAEDDSSSTQESTSSALQDKDGSNPSLSNLHIKSSLSSDTNVNPSLPDLNSNSDQISNLDRECNHTPVVSTTFNASDPITQPVPKTTLEPHLLDSSVQSTQPKVALIPSKLPVDTAASQDSFSPQNQISTNDLNTNQSFDFSTLYNQEDNNQTISSTHIVSSKIQIMEIPPASSTSRSNIIPYTVAPITPIITYSNKLPIIEIDTPHSIFGDPNPINTFSSDSESDHDSLPDMDTSEVIQSDLQSRKRKVSSISDDIPSPDLKFPSCSTSDTIQDLNESLQIPDNKTIISLMTSPPARTPLFQKVSTLFASEDPLTDQLEQICPNKSFTPELINIFKLLINQGFNIYTILSFPQILIIRLTELKKKIKYLQKHMGTFSIEDIWRQTKIETRASSNTLFLPELSSTSGKPPPF